MRDLISEPRNKTWPSRPPRRDLASIKQGMPVSMCIVRAPQPHPEHVEGCMETDPALDAGAKVSPRSAKAQLFSLKSNKHRFAPLFPSP
ncbi:MAG: hypothetical protein ACJAZW_000209 [Maritalea sp.]|jgi:hypothetical protein